MYLCVCIYVYVKVNICVCVLCGHTCACIYDHSHARECVRARVVWHMRMCVCDVDMCIYDVYEYMCVYVNVYMQVLCGTCVCTHMCVCDVYMCILCEDICMCIYEYACIGECVQCVYVFCVGTRFCAYTGHTCACQCVHVCIVRAHLYAHI